MQMRGAVSVFLLALFAVFLSACERYPDDPKHTLEQVLERGVLRVGVIASPPWTVVDGERVTGGIEPALVSRFADSLGVEVNWHVADAQRNFEALQHYDLDLVIGGLLRSNPWRKHAGFTIPYYTGPVWGSDDKHEHVMAVPSGENAMIMRLERFLLNVKQQGQIEALIESVAKR